MHESYYRTYHLWIPLPNLSLTVCLVCTSEMWQVTYIYNNYRRSLLFTITELEHDVESESKPGGDSLSEKESVPSHSLSA